MRGRYLVWRLWVVGALTREVQKPEPWRHVGPWTSMMTSVAWQSVQFCLAHGSLSRRFHAIPRLVSVCALSPSSGMCGQAVVFALRFH